MKAARYFVLIIAIGLGLYLYFHKDENFKVKDHIVVSQGSGMDFDAPSIAAPPKFAVIQGTITNISEKNFSDVVVIYQSGKDTVNALIGNLQKEQKSDFQTNRMMVRTNRPDYKLIDILFKEVK